MRNRVVFLDIDGVLNDSKTEDRSPYGFIGIDGNKVLRLARIVNETGADVVLTSTWKSEWDPDPGVRTEDGQYMDDVLREHGVVIADKTVDRMSNRGQGIRLYLDAHEEITSWVVLDDDIFSDYDCFGIMPHLVKTVYGAPGGLEDHHVDEAIGILLGNSAYDG